MQLTKGNVYQHKEGCRCFRCSRVPWNLGMKGFLAGKDHWNYGHKVSDEIKKKMSENRKGKGMGEGHAGWKGDKVKYRALHNWVERRRGKASYCMKNKDHISTRYHWANISREYKRDLEDWIQLCPSCHMNYDRRGGSLLSE